MKDFIWTKHATKRIRDRKISEEQVLKAINYPDKTFSSNDGSTEYQKLFNHQTVAAVVKENDRGEKIIVSLWVNPPNAGTLDFKRKERYKKMQNASFLKKLWFTLLNQLGF